MTTLLTTVVVLLLRVGTCWNLILEMVNVQEQIAGIIGYN